MVTGYSYNCGKVIEMNGRSILLVLFALVSACKGGDEAQSDLERLGRATGPVPPSRTVKKANQSQMPERSEAIVYEGEVVEFIDVARYTYLKIKDRNGALHWAAILKDEFAVGQKVKIAQSIVKNQWKSPSLNRTFDTVIFGSIVNGETESKPRDELPSGHPPIKEDPQEEKNPGEKKREDDKVDLPPGHPPIQ